ncbi:hypothetical protein MPSEU_000850500 [Mayamaea pseudoterrestris]|nr:hypothetical protein MPSEU_000850500 [Mayamaea pseudoterrestris]
MLSSLMRQVFVLVAILKSALGNKDDTYYPNGVVNPNVRRNMYWNDASNVLQDIDQFAELYVQFHSCAWSPFVSNSRAGNVDENDYWYLNAMPSSGANVAYSLYGVLEGDRLSGCNKRTYINSFYTTSGFPVFANTLASAGISNTGTQYSTECENGVGLACSDHSGSSTFVVTDYNGGQCIPENAKTAWIPSALADFNTLLKDEAQCAKIYSAGDSAPTILSYSKACFLEDSIGACPDPYGKKTAYERDLSRVTYMSGSHRRDIRQGSIMMGVGAVFLLAAALLLHQGSKSYPIPLGYRFVKKRKSRGAKSPKSSRTKSPKSRTKSPKSSEKSPREKKAVAPKSPKDDKSTRSKRRSKNDDVADGQDRVKVSKSVRSSKSEAARKNISLAPMAQEDWVKTRSRSLPVAAEAPPSPPAALDRSPSFASARSNIEVQAPDGLAEYDYNDNEQFDNEYDAKPKGRKSKHVSRSSESDIQTRRHSSDRLLGGFGAWLGNGSTDAADRADASPNEIAPAPSGDILLTPSFLAASDGDESGPDSQRSNTSKIRRLLAMRRKQNNQSAM